MSLRLFQHTELEHTPLATFTNRLFQGIPFIIGVAGGWPAKLCQISSTYEVYENSFGFQRIDSIASSSNIYIGSTPHPGCNRGK